VGLESFICGVNTMALMCRSVFRMFCIENPFIIDYLFFILLCLLLLRLKNGIRISLFSLMIKYL